MKKYLAIIVLFLTISSYGQDFSKSFDVKKYANTQTEMIQTALNLDQTTTDKLYQANLNKAYSIHKYLILAEKRGNVAGTDLNKAIQQVEKDAERGSGYQTALKSILGEEKYQEYLDKFSN